MSIIQRSNLAKLTASEAWAVVVRIWLAARVVLPRI